MTSTKDFDGLSIFLVDTFNNDYIRYILIYEPYIKPLNMVNMFDNHLEGFLRSSLHKKDYKISLHVKVSFHFLQQHNEFYKSMFFLIHIYHCSW